MRVALWEVSLNGVLQCLMMNFVWFQIEFDGNIPHRKYQAKFQSSMFMVFSCLCCWHTTTTSVLMPLSQEIRVDNFCFNLGTSSFTIFCILLLQSESSQIIFRHSSHDFLSWPFSLLPPVPGLQVFTNWCPHGWHDHATAVVRHLDNPSSENITWDSITQSYTKHRPGHKPLHPTQPQLVCNSKFSSLCCCYSSQKSLLSFGPTE